MYTTTSATSAIHMLSMCVEEAYSALRRSMTLADTNTLDIV
jgi:hypothetical protein